MECWSLLLSPAGICLRWQIQPSTDMSAHTALFLGHAAMVDEDYDAALKHYSSAIELEPNNADCYSKRAAAQLKRSRFTDAVSDASASVKIEPSAKAYQRKAVACFNLQEYESACAAFNKAIELDGEGSRELRRWIRKCNAEINLEAAGAVAPTSSGSSTANPAAPAAGASSSAPAPIVDPSRVRHEW